MTCSRCHCPDCRPSGASVSGRGWTTHHGSAEWVISTAIQSGTVDAIITDPPYGTGANTAAGRRASTSKKYQSGDAKKLFADFDGDSLSPSAWRSVLSEAMRAAVSACRPAAPVVLFCDWRSVGPMADLAQPAGVSLVGCATWDKIRGRPVPDGPRASTELILFGLTAGKSRTRKEATYMPGVLAYPSVTPARRHHPTQKPVELMEALLRLTKPCDTILDPFAGSGSTGVAAITAGRRYVGIESTEHYHAVAVDRLRQAEADLVTASD